MMSAINIEKLSDNVQLLQRDMAQVGLLVERLDITIEKLTEVSSNVSNLLAVQGSRLEVQEKNSDKLHSMFERSRTETDAVIKNVNDKIIGVEKDLKRDFDSSHNDIIKKFEEMTKEQSKQHEETGKRISRLERLMWLAMGGGASIIFILEKILPLFT